MAKEILIVDDEPNVVVPIQFLMEQQGYRVMIAERGEDALDLIYQYKPDLVLLDIMLPGMNGYDVCRNIKNDAEIKDIPVIILSAKEKEIDVILGLELGADDYVPKPFSPKVLFSRVKAVLRRKSPQAKGEKIHRFGNFQLDVDRYEVIKDNKILPLTLSEFGILKRLLMNRGRVLTRNQLLDNLQNDDAFIVDRNIDVHVASLRKKLGPNFSWIETVRGVGYRFKEHL